MSEFIMRGDESEYNGAHGDTAVPIRKRRGAGVGNFNPSEASLSTAEKARLERLTASHDPAKPRNQRIWTGQSEKRTLAQIEGDKANDTGNTGS